jgi:hypothetical protein
MLVILSLKSFSQDQGIVSGNVMFDNKSAAMGATVELASLSDSSFKKAVVADKSGEFYFPSLPNDWFQLRITSVGYSLLQIDSIHIRPDRFNFNLPDLVLRESADQMQDVIVYAEKPLIQSKDGNITFNAAESPLSAGATASELLKNVPLVTVDE